MKKIMQKVSIAAFLFVFLFALQMQAVAQDEGYEFTDKVVHDATSVKNQYRSGTCWAFSALSFFESELIRMGKGEYDLSEMFVIWHSYSDKARKYVRLHGHLNFGAGGAFHDVQNVMRSYGIVPEGVYDGLNIGEDKHIHAEMDAVLQGIVEQVIKDKNKKLTSAWEVGFDAMLDAYLGEIPEEFEYEGKTYTPQSFYESLELDVDDYVNITSYTHHPFYEPFIIEVPDNWAWGEVYNVPLDDLEEIMNHAIDEGYTVAWASDVSEKGFSFTNGVAVVPDRSATAMSNLERARWESLPQNQREAMLYNLDAPGKEKTITQELRQQAFDNYHTTDDHGMHIVGYAEDQDGTLYYKVKNSWDTNNIHEGYFYASKAFVLYKTMSIMVHKESIPADIREKLGL